MKLKSRPSLALEKKSPIRFNHAWEEWLSTIANDQIHVTRDRTKLKTLLLLIPTCMILKETLHSICRIIKLKCPLILHTIALLSKSWTSKSLAFNYRWFNVTKVAFSTHCTNIIRFLCPQAKASSERRLSTTATLLSLADQPERGHDVWWNLLYWAIHLHDRWSHSRNRDGHWAIVRQHLISHLEEIKHLTEPWRNERLLRVFAR